MVCEMLQWVFSGRLLRLFSGSGLTIPLTLVESIPKVMLDIAILNPQFFDS
jgi:hypothetical protein